MTDRKKQVEELMEGFMSLKHRAALKKRAAKTGPRITPAQWSVVMYLRNHGACTVKDIAAAFSITSSAATQLVDGLVKSGYVSRKASARDRRAVELTLSRKTFEHVEAMKKMAVAEFLQLFKALSDEEFKQYCALNKKITAGFMQP